MSKDKENKQEIPPKEIEDTGINKHKAKKDDISKNRKELRENLRLKRKRNIIVNIICLLLLIIGITWIFRFFWHYRSYEITNDASIDQYIAPISAKVQGYIKKIYFTEHQKINKGDTLVILDNNEYRIKLLETEAALKDAEASYEVLKSNIIASKHTESITDANIQEAKVHMINAKKDYKRYENLLKEESVSEQQYEQMKTQYEALKAHYESLVLQKETNQASTEVINKKKGNIEAAILRSQANVDLAKLNLSYTIITAPYDGYVGRRAIQEGELVQAGQVLTNIAKSGDKWVTANYKEKQINNIYIGQEVNIKVDAFKGKIFKGKVTAISEATGSKYSLIPTDNSTGNFVKIQQRIPVRINFININPEEMARLRVGMMVETEAIK